MISKKKPTGHEKRWFDSKLIKWLTPSLEQLGEEKKKKKRTPTPYPRKRAPKITGLAFIVL